MPNRNYRLGTSFEHRVILALTKAGYHCVRSAGSHGVVDIVALLMDNGVGLYGWGHALVQCKRSGALPPLERKALLSVAARTGATPVLARMPPKKRTGIEFWRLTGTGAKDRERWEP